MFCRWVTLNNSLDRFVWIIPSNPVSKTSWGNPSNVVFCQSNNYPQGFAMRIVRVVFLGISVIFKWLFLCMALGVKITLNLK
jgi:hypothetical protein